MPVTLPPPYNNAPIRLADVTQTMLDLYNVVQQINAGAAISSFDVTAPSTVTANSATNALTITQTGTGNALVVEDSASPDTSPFVIDTNGVVMTGIPTARVNFGGGQTPDCQIEKLNAGSLSITRISASNFLAPTLFFAKAHGSGTLSNGIVTANDIFGLISFNGSDGVSLWSGAQISSVVDGTPGINNIPGRLIFSTTPTGSNISLERMRIDNAGGISFNKTVTPPGTTGAQTINKPTGTVNFAPAASTLVVSNSLVTTSSIILLTVGSADTTMKSTTAVAGAGSFTITANAPATAETIVNFVVFN